MKLTLFGKIVVSIAVSLIAWGFLYAFKTATQRLTAQDHRIIIGEKALDFWFTPDHHLAVLTEGTSELTLRLGIWDNKGQPVSNASINLSSFASFLGGQSPSGDSSPSYAISADARLIAWVEKHTLRVRRLQAEITSAGSFPNLASIPIQHPSKVVRLSFFDDANLVVLFEDGKLEIRNWQVADSPVIGTFLDGPLPTWRTGGLLAVASFPTGDIGLITLPGGNSIFLKMIPHVPIRNGLSLAAAGLDRLAVGTEDGRVILINPTVDGLDPRPSQIGGHKSAVRTLQFYNRDVVVAGGDLEGIYSVEKSEGTLERRVGAAINKLVIDGEFVAFGTARTTEMIWLAYRMRLNTDQQFVISILFGLALFFVPYLGKHLRTPRQ